MEDKHLDQWIGDKLGNLDVPYQSSSWEQLQGRLEEEEASDHDFDAAMRERLSDIEISYRPSYWNMLAARLEEEDALRRQFIRLKSIELGLLFLLLITFINISPTAIERINKVSFDQTISNTASSAVVESVPLIAESETKEKVAVINPLPEYASVFTSPTRPLEEEALAALPVSGVSSAFAKAEEVSKIQKRGVDEVQDELVSATPFLLNDQHKASPSIVFPKPRTRKHLRVGMFSSLNGDYINTPYDEILNQAAYSRVAVNYGGGFSVSWEWSKWEIETGLAYNHKEYSPEQTPVLFGNTVDGYNVEGLLNIELNTFQIPLQVKYDVKQTSKWHFYTASGVSLHVITQANYDVKSTMASQLNIGSSPTISKNEYQLSSFQLDRFKKYARPSEPQSDKLKKKKFADGWVSGGTFRENSYYTANIGLGIERFIDEKWSVFVQPTYRQNLPFINGGIGPNQDRISTLELLIGAKVGL